MNETQLKELLDGADQAFAADMPVDPAALSKNAQRKAGRRKMRQTLLLLGSACVLLAAAWLAGYNQYTRRQEQKQIALQIKVQQEIADLKVQAEQTLALIRSANQRTQKRKQILELQRQLASITAQSARTENTDEQLAGELYQKAQTLSAHADSCHAVKALYQQILRTFPNSSYVSGAKENLAQLNCPNGISL